jgi:hypothetical protein
VSDARKGNEKQIFCVECQMHKKDTEDRRNLVMICGEVVDPVQGQHHITSHHITSHHITSHHVIMSVLRFAGDRERARRPATRR